MDGEDTKGIRLPGERRDRSDTRIVGMQVVAGNFLDEIGIHFNNNLNCLIGGRGTGKSATLETMWYVLDLPTFVKDRNPVDLVRATG